MVSDRLKQISWKAVAAATVGLSGLASPPASAECAPVVVGTGVERCVEVKPDGSVRLFLDRADPAPWTGTYVEENEPVANYCGPTAGMNFLFWYGIATTYGELANAMKTNTWDNGPVLGAAGQICAFEPICTSIVASTVSDIAVTAGSLPRFVRDTLYERMPPGYRGCGTEGIDSLDDIRASLASGNPVVYLESGGRFNLHWAVITGLENAGDDVELKIANSGNRLWSSFRNDWSLHRIAGADSPESACAPNEEQGGELCYPSCRSGYDGAGPVCWQRCPDGYSDDPATCRRDGSIVPADNRHCPPHDTCGLTLARGCSHCPEGYTNDGCTCRRDPHILRKDSYGRGAGTPHTGAMLRILGQGDLGLLPYVAIRWCGAPQ